MASGVWSWGEYREGRSAPGIELDHQRPFHLPRLAGAIAVCREYDWACALDAEGTVWTWGENRFGQLGDGTTSDRVVPRPVEGLSSIASIATDSSTGYALRSDGSVWTWGDNYLRHRALGRLDIDNRQYLPERVDGLDGVRTIHVKGGVALAVRNDGTVWAWGEGGERMRYGLLGDGTDDSHRAEPAPVPGLVGIVSVTQEDSTAYALDVEGAVWCWGKNGLGNYWDGSKFHPSRLPGVEGVTTLVSTPIFFGSNDSTYALYAIAKGGEVWAWGGNKFGALGDGTTEDRDSPVQVGGLRNVRQIVAAYGSAFALDSDGLVWAWGKNRRGELGDGGTTDRHSPAPVVALSEIAELADAHSGCVARRSDGTLWAWGQLRNVQLPDDDIEACRTPSRVVGLTRVSEIIGNGYVIAALPDQVSAAASRPPAPLQTRSTAGDPLRQTSIPFLVIALLCVCLLWWYQTR